MGRSIAVYSSLPETITGKLIIFKSHSNSIVDENCIVVVENLTLEIARSLSKFRPKAILTKKGSFANHAAGHLNGESIPLFIAKDSFVSIDALYIRVNGEDEIASLSNEPFIDNTQKSTDTITKSILNTSPIYYKDRRIYVSVDGSDPDKLALGFKNGADNVGVLRTEWLGWDSQNSPTVDDHLQLLTECQQRIDDKLLTVRLFDFGGSKVPRWAQDYKDFLESPLGLRGIRAYPLLKSAYDSQFKAIHKFSENHRIRIIIPMITHVEEIKSIKNIFFDLCGISSLNMEFGVMVETPSSALEIDDILQEVDSVRIGPGDLSQFTLATLRESILPKDFSYKGFSDSVLNLITIVSTECTKKSKKLSLCLDIPPSDGFVKSLLDIGISDFCVSPCNVLGIRRTLQNLTS